MKQSDIDRNLLFSNTHLVEVQKFILSYLSSKPIVWYCTQHNVVWVYVPSKKIASYLLLAISKRVCNQCLHKSHSIRNRMPTDKDTTKYKTAVFVRAGTDWYSIES